MWPYQAECLVGTVDNSFTVFPMLNRIAEPLFFFFQEFRIGVLSFSPKVLGGRDTIIDPGRTTNKVAHRCTRQFGHLRHDLDTR